MAKRYPITDQAAPSPRWAAVKDSARQASKTISKLAESKTRAKANAATPQRLSSELVGA